MSYIRTKGSIYEGEKINDNTFLINGRNGHKYQMRINYINFVNEADTIDELCDLFIDEETKTIFHKHNGYVINWKTNMVYSLKALSESYHSVKGAIWTSKGLIYVAKLNDEGKLCRI